MSKEVERALRHRCQRIHEEERRVPGFMRRSSQPRPSLRSTSSTTSTASTTSSSTRARSRRSYLASVPEDGEDEVPGVEDENEEEDLEKEAGAYEAFIQGQDDDDFVVGYPRIMVESSFYWRKHFRDFPRKS